MQNSLFRDEILSIKSKNDFEELALELFFFQSERNSIYSQYIKSLKIQSKEVSRLMDVPFLPIEFFKTHEVHTEDFIPEAIFTSSGTTGSNTSRHRVKSLKWYKSVFESGFSHFYGQPENYSILALLPSYLERTGSSLVTMVQGLMNDRLDPSCGFFLRNYDALAVQLLENERQKKKSLLIGVTYALIEFAEKFPIPLKNTIVMETGGMKGMRQELTRDEVYDILMKAFAIEEVHSEYGMTELLSQAYSLGKGLFNSPQWMSVIPRDTNDPLCTFQIGKGALNIIDLANIDSCAFIATQDVGEVFENGNFKVLGRMDRADIRGCNLLVL